MKRSFDFTLSIILIIILFPILLILALLISLTSSGSPIYWSNRVGLNNTIFKMPKLRTMHLKTPTVPTHLLDNPSQFLTPIGSWLRRTSLDELPQIWCILIGKMSFVGPRPALYNQHDLITLRANLGIEKVLPGLTGWAQVNGRDELSVIEKVALDHEYIQKKCFSFDVYVLYLTVIKVLNGRGISH